jgi:hypothetical protein
MERSFPKVGYLTLHRSRKLHAGCFRNPGQLHLHVDARDQGLLESLIPQLEEVYDAHTKLNIVHESVRGSQWTEAVFGPHSSSGVGDECFLSVSLKSRPQCIGVVRYLLSAVKRAPGVVVEVERVVGRYSRDGGRKMAPQEVVPPISGYEVSYEPDSAPAVELHFCFEIVADEEPLDIVRLPKELADLGLPVGSWSRFERGARVWSYRSTSFSSKADFAAACSEGYRILGNYLAKLDYPIAELWIIAEEILGLWKEPFRDAEDSAFKNRVSIPELVGTTDDALPNFSTVIQQCQKPTQGDCERELGRTEDLAKFVESFRRIAIELQLQPILFELAVTQDSEPRGFASIMVSYADAPEDPFLLRAWQTSINEILDSYNDVISPVSPIMFHPETYESGYLFEHFDWIIERTYSDLFPLGPGVQSAWEALNPGRPENVDVLQAARDLKSAACRGYQYPLERVTDSAPVWHTLGRLCTGVASELMQRLQAESASNPKERVLEVIRILARSCLVVVPFRWRSRAKEQNQDHNGGCVFAVVAATESRRKPSGKGDIARLARSVSSPAQITSGVIGDLAIRFGWILFRAALEDAYVGYSMSSKKKQKPWTIHEAREALEFSYRLRKALDGLNPDTSARTKVDQLKLVLPDLGSAGTSPRLPHLLTGPFHTGSTWPEIMLLKYGKSRAEIYRDWRTFGLVKRG